MITLLAPSSMSYVNYISLLSGYISMAFWLFAQIPQVLENYRNSSVDGIAFGFLAFWIFGDISNLLGCLLTDALPFQILLSSYYCCIDVILISQYFYYTRVYPKIYQFKNTERMAFMNDQEEEEEEEEDEFPIEHIRRQSVNFRSPHKNSTGKYLTIPQSRTAFPKRSLSTSSSFTNLVTASFITSFTKVEGYPLAANNALNSTPTIMSFLSENSKLIGVCFAWICTFSYLFARIPQLLKNYKRKSSEGISILLFICALNGNIFYTISILTSSELVDAPTSELKQAFLLKELPYILGSAGTVMFDIIALLQFYMYNYSAQGNEGAVDRPRLRIGDIDDSWQNGDYPSSPVNGATYNLIMANRHPHEFIQKLNQEEVDEQKSKESHPLETIHSTNNDEIDCQSALLEHASVNSYSSSNTDENHPHNNVELFETSPEESTVNHLHHQNNINNNNNGKHSFVSSLFGNVNNNSVSNNITNNNNSFKFPSFSAVGSLKELISNYDINNSNKPSIWENSENSINNSHKYLSHPDSLHDNSHNNAVNNANAAGTSSSFKVENAFNNNHEDEDEKTSTKKKYKSKISMAFTNKGKHLSSLTINNNNNLKFNKNDSDISVQQSITTSNTNSTTNDMTEDIANGIGSSNTNASPLTPWDVLALQDNMNNNNGKTFATAIKS